MYQKMFFNFIVLNMSYEKLKLKNYRKETRHILRKNYANNQTYTS